MFKKNKCKYLAYYSELLACLPSCLKVTKINEDIHHIAPKELKSSKKVVLVSLTHGDEVIGLHIFIKLLKAIVQNELHLKGELFLVLANSQAYLRGQRYIESDLNRAYGENGNQTLEEKRANSIKPIIDKCDYVIDIHQCIEETLHPFFILPFSYKAHSWILSVDTNIPIIIRKNIAQASTLASYGFLSNKYSVTFEVGAYGYDHEQVHFGFKVITSFLKVAWQHQDTLKTVHKPRLNPIFEIQYFQPYVDGKIEFSQVFRNFDAVEKGQIIAYLDETPIRAAIGGKILLYPRKFFTEGSQLKAEGLFFILQESQLF